MTTTINVALQNQQVDAVGVAFDLGFIELYVGAQPAPNDAPTGTLLVQCALAADAYSAPTLGTETALGVVQGVAVANGIAGYARQVSADGLKWMYASVSGPGGGGDVQINPTTIAIGNIVTIDVSTLTQPSG